MELLQEWNRLLPQWFLCFLAFLYCRDIGICLVGQVDFIVPETWLRVANHEAVFQSNLLVLFSSKLFNRLRKRMKYNNAAT